MSDLFSIGLSGLAIARTALVTTAHNTANVSTDGYSRQRVVVETTPALAAPGGFVGSGARVTSVQRSYDAFLNAQLSQADSSAAGLDTYSTQIGRLDDLLADRTSGLSSLMQNFFSSVQGVADTPADPAARQQMLSSAEAMAGKFRSVDAYLSELNGSVNDQITGSVAQVNGIASQIATLNRQINQLSAAAGGQPPNDLLDTRDKLVSQLSAIVGVSVVQQDGGMYNVSIGAGQSLVLGDRACTLVAVPSAADPTRVAVGVQGASGQILQLRDQDLAGGSLGGLVAFRSQALASTQNAIGRLATTLAASFNAQHQAGVDLQGNAGGNFFSLAGPQTFAGKFNKGDLALAASITDAGSLTTSDYSVAVEPAGGGGLQFVVTRLSDGQQVPATLTPATGDPTSFSSLTFDGITVAPQVPPGGAIGTPQAGDSFVVQPTRCGASDLAVLVKDPSQIAAGDPGSSGPSDGRNALALASLQLAKTVDDGTASFNDAYASLVGDVGNRAQEVQIAYDSQSSLAGQVRASQQAVSGVNQDEEAANLMQYQQLYQANAKVIQAASTIFDTILGLQ